jgi:hypothetical protein
MAALGAAGQIAQTIFGQPRQMPVTTLPDISGGDVGGLTSRQAQDLTNTLQQDLVLQSQQAQQSIESSKHQATLLKAKQMELKNSMAEEKLRSETDKFEAEAAATAAFNAGKRSYQTLTVTEDGVTKTVDVMTDGQGNIIEQIGVHQEEGVYTRNVPYVDPQTSEQSYRDALVFQPTTPGQKPRIQYLGVSKPSRKLESLPSLLQYVRENLTEEQAEDGTFVREVLQDAVNQGFVDPAGAETFMEVYYPEGIDRFGWFAGADPFKPLTVPAASPSGQMPQVVPPNVDYDWQGTDGFYYKEDPATGMSRRVF